MGLVSTANIWLVRRRLSPASDTQQFHYLELFIHPQHVNWDKHGSNVILILIVPRYRDALTENTVKITYMATFLSRTALRKINRTSLPNSKCSDRLGAWDRVKKLSFCTSNCMSATARCIYPCPCSFASYDCFEYTIAL